MAHDVFISYSAKGRNTKIANDICAELEKNRIRCWIAPRDVRPGHPFPAQIVEAINESRVFVLVFSNDSNHSPHVLREVERAVHRGIPIIPFRIEDFQLSKNMEYLLGATHWLDALAPPIEKHLKRLVEIVNVILKQGDEEASVPLTPLMDLLIRPVWLWSGVILLFILLGWLITALFLAPGNTWTARIFFRLFLSLVLLLVSLLCLRRGLASDLIRGQSEPPADVWGWLLPVFLGLLGGMISWKRYRSRARRQAINMLTVGIVSATLSLIFPSMTLKNGQYSVAGKRENIMAFHELGEWKVSWEAPGLFVDGDTVYLANGKGGLVVLDVKDPSAPRNIGGFPLDDARDVVVADNKAYVTGQGEAMGPELTHDQIVILDVSDPSAPEKIADVLTEDNDFHRSLQELAVDGDILYTTTSSELILWDLTEEHRPTRLGEFTFESNVAFPGVVARDGIAYVIANRLHVVDCTDPLHPKEISGLEAGMGSSICIEGNIAYVVGWSEGLLTVDISDPEHIVALGRFKEILAESHDAATTAAYRQTMYGVSVSNNIAYVGYSYGIDHGTWVEEMEGGIVAIDVSDPRNPKKLAVYSGLENITDIFASEDRVYVTDSSRGLVILGPR